MFHFRSVALLPNFPTTEGYHSAQWRDPILVSMATANRETSCHHCGGVLNQFLLKSCWCAQKWGTWVISAVVPLEWRHLLPPGDGLPGGQRRRIKLGAAPPPLALAASFPRSARDPCQSFGCWMGVYWLLKRPPVSSPQKNKGSVLAALVAARARVCDHSPPPLGIRKGWRQWWELIWQVKGSHTHTHTLQTVTCKYVYPIKMSAPTGKHERPLVRQLTLRGVRKW